MKSFVVCYILASSLATVSSAFSLQQQKNRRFALQTTALSALSSSSSSLVVISPPGGVGEVAAVKAAEMGSSVRWFVVSQQQTGAEKVVLAQESLDSIAAAGGNVELAGADAASLLLPVDDSASALPAVSAWCGSADSIVCTYDGVQDAKPVEESAENPETVWRNSIKVAAKEAGKSIGGTKLTILSATDELQVGTDEESSNRGGGLGGLVGNLLGGDKVKIPVSLAEALSQDTTKVTCLRHGQLFGMPESSPDFSPLVGGPRRDPELCEEYAMRAVRVDPSLSLSGNIMMGSNTQSSRHAVGEAAALMATGQVPFPVGADIGVSSQRGTEPTLLETWKDEFVRVEKMLSSGAGAQLFTTEFSSVPDADRLADWLATKWAPAVLRTYDIATIRSGARPVYASRAASDNEKGMVEIVWQKLVNYESVTVGKMSIQVSDTGLVASRGAGDASKGFGSISKTPLAGEDVLVRRLSEAASQAIEKGLAKKVAKKKVVVKTEAPQPEPVVAATSIMSSGTVEKEAASSSESGPRQAGARRSQERARGTRRKRERKAKDE